MIHHREGLPLRFETRDHAAGMLYPCLAICACKTPEDFLAEIADEMFKGPPPKDFVAKRDAILKAFYTAARSSARRPAPGDR